MAERRAHANVKCFHECDDGDSEMLFELENAMRCDALNCMCECMYLLPSSRVACLGVAAMRR